MSTTNVEPLRLTTDADGCRTWSVPDGHGFEAIAITADPVGDDELAVTVFDLVNTEVEQNATLRLPAGDETETLLDIIARTVAKAVTA